MAIKSKLNLLGAISTCSLLLGIAVIHVMLGSTHERIDEVKSKLTPELNLAEHIRYNLVQIQQCLTDFAATRGQDGMDDGIKKAAEFKREFENSCEQLLALSRTNGQTNVTHDLEAIRLEFETYWTKGSVMANEYATAGTTAGNQIMSEFDKTATDLLDRLKPFVKETERQFDASLESVQIANDRLTWIVTLGGVLLAVVILALNLWSYRSISNSISKSVLSMHSNIVLTSAVSRRIAESSEALADGAGSQAASVEQTSASLEEMSSVTKRNSESAQRANELAKDTRLAAEQGAEDMQTMNTAMEAIRLSSQEISKIIKTIDEIAFQTNILALNAAVEAARAGEAGMGFSVVADEVRNLAQRSAQAAKETSDKIKGALSDTTRGVELSGKVAETLSNIVARAREMNSLAAELANASAEQAQGIVQINQAVGQVDSVTQLNAKSAQENATAARELNTQTGVLKEAVEHMIELLGGSFSESSPSHRETRTGGIIQWDETEMTTSVQSVDEQHQELIRLINAVHETAKKRKTGDELMRQLHFLGEYAQNHFAHEEGVMEKHQCPSAGKNKLAHAKFLRSYQELVQEAQRNGPTPQLAKSVEKMLAEWLSSHICKIDTGLRGCHTPESRTISKTKAQYRQELALTQRAGF